MMLSLSLAFIVLALVLARRVSREIADLLRRLRKDAIRMGGGAMIAEVAGGIDEIDVVQHALATGQPRTRRQRAAPARGDRRRGRADAPGAAGGAAQPEAGGASAG